MDAARSFLSYLCNFCLQNMITQKYFSADVFFGMIKALWGHFYFLVSLDREANVDIYHSPALNFFPECGKCILIFCILFY